MVTTLIRKKKVMIDNSVVILNVPIRVGLLRVYYRLSSLYLSSFLQHVQQWQESISDGETYSVSDDGHKRANEENTKLCQTARSKRATLHFTTILKQTKTMTRKQLSNAAQFISHNKKSDISLCRHLSHLNMELILYTCFDAISTTKLQLHHKSCIPHTCTTLYGHIKTTQQWAIIEKYGDWYTGHWWVGCYIWYSEEGPWWPTHQQPAYQLHIIRCGTIIASAL